MNIRNWRAARPVALTCGIVLAAGALVGQTEAASYTPAGTAPVWNDDCGNGGSRNNNRGGGGFGGFGNLLGNIAGDLLGQELRDRGLSSQTQRHASQFLASSIACALSPREQEQAQDAELAALNSGATGQASERTWTSGERRGVGGGSQVIERTGDPGDGCAITRTMITDENGDEVAVRRRRCQLPDGTWSDGEQV